MGEINSLDQTSSIPGPDSRGQSAYWRGLQAALTELFEAIRADQLLVGP